MLRLHDIQIDNRAKQRRAGYADAIRAHARQREGYWLIQPQVYFRVAAQFPPLEPPLPSLRTQAAGLMQAAGQLAHNLVTGQRLLVPDDVREARAAICKACEHFRQSDGRCSLCGCWAKSKSPKIHIAPAKCPDNPPRWGAWIG